MAWKPGQSGNPGGRPPGLRARVIELVDMDKLIETLQTIAFSPEESTRDRIEAVTRLMDRGWGKPHQTMSIDADLRHDVLDVLAMTPQQREQRITELEEKRRMRLLADPSRMDTVKTQNDGG